MLYDIAVPIEDKLSRFDPATNIGDIVSNSISMLFIVAGLATFLWFTWGGLEWLLAGGDKAKVEEARHRITNAIIGLAIVAASWAIFNLLDYFFGLNLTG